MSDTRITLESIWNDMNKLPRTRARGEHFEKWLVNIKANLIDKYYVDFELANLRLIVIGTSGLPGFNESLAFVSEVADIKPKNVPLAVKHFINRINGALQQPALSLKSSECWSKLDFTCRESLREVLFINICLSTNAKLLYNSIYSLDFLHRILLKTEHVAILDLRMAKNVHQEDLQAVELETIRKHSALPCELRELLETFTTMQIKYKANLKCIQTMFDNIPDEFRLFTIETFKKGPEIEMELRQKEHLRKINEKLKSFADTLPKSDKLKRPLLATLQQDLIALVLKTYQSDSKFKFELPSGRGHRFARIGNPGETSYSEFDDHRVTAVLCKFNRKFNGIIGRLYRSAEETQTNEVSSTTEIQPKEESASDIPATIDTKQMTKLSDENVN